MSVDAEREEVRERTDRLEHNLNDLDRLGVLLLEGNRDEGLEEREIPWNENQSWRASPSERRTPRLELDEVKQAVEVLESTAVGDQFRLCEGIWKTNLTIGVPVKHHRRSPRSA